MYRKRHFPDLLDAHRQSRQCCRDAGGKLCPQHRAMSKRPRGMRLNPRTNPRLRDERRIIGELLDTWGCVNLMNDGYVYQRIEA